MRVLILALLLPFPAQAACTGTTLLSCNIKADQLEVCLNGDTLTYAFGPEGAPELALAEPLSNGTYTPWNGIGRDLWEVVAFRSGNYVYNVYSIVDRSVEEPTPEWGVTVENNGDPINVLTCDAPETFTPFDVLYDEMTARGYCWNREMDAWQTGVCP